MSGTPVELYVSLKLPPVTVRDALMRVMRAIAQGAIHYRKVRLSAPLEILGGGSVSVPIEAQIENRPGRWECAIHIEAAQTGKFFPTFDGTIAVTPDGADASELWLQGTYAPPGGILGKGLDSTVMRGVAEKSLNEFLESIAESVRQEVERTERERAQQALRYHG